MRVSHAAHKCLLRSQRCNTHVNPESCHLIFLHAQTHSYLPTCWAILLVHVSARYILYTEVKLQHLFVLSTNNSVHSLIEECTSTSTIADDELNSELEVTAALSYFEWFFSLGWPFNGWFNIVTPRFFFSRWVWVWCVGRKFWGLQIRFRDRKFRFWVYVLVAGFRG